MILTRYYHLLDILDCVTAKSPHRQGGMSHILLKDHCRPYHSQPFPASLVAVLHQIEPSITTKPLTNEFYIQSPRLQTAVLLLISERHDLGMSISLTMNVNHGQHQSHPWSSFSGEGQLAEVR
jgi:hypothetical protein